MSNQTVLTGILLDENEEFTLDELRSACNVTHEWIENLIAEGIIEPVGDTSELRFQSMCLRRIHIVKRLETDLGINVAGAALALELLDEVEELRNRIRLLEKIQNNKY